VFDIREIFVLIGYRQQATELKIDRWGTYTIGLCCGNTKRLWFV